MELGWKMLLLVSLERVFVVFGESARVVLDEAGQSVYLFVGRGLSERVGERVDRLVENAVVGLGVDLEGALQVEGGHLLLLNQSAENGQLDHVAQVELRVPRLALQLELDLAQLEVAQKAALGRWLADEVVGDVEEADRLVVVVDGQVERLAVAAHERDALPRVPALLLPAVLRPKVRPHRRRRALRVVRVVELSVQLELPPQNSSMLFEVVGAAAVDHAGEF